MQSFHVYIQLYVYINMMCYINTQEFLVYA